MNTGNKICAFITCFAALGLAAIFFIATAVEERNVLADKPVNSSDAPVIKVGTGDEKAQFLSPVDGTSAPTSEPSIEPTEAATAEAMVSLGVFKVTAYCHCELCCPGTADGITFTETNVKEGRTIAADPNVIPFGSTIIVDGHEYIVEDKGGWIGNQVDIYMESHQEALEYGVQYHEVFITSTSK